MNPDGPPSPEQDPAETVSSYWEAEKLVLCDRKNPRAWIKSDVTVSIGQSDTPDVDAAPEPEE